jgi:uncharacterized protein (TIGR02284 family)
MSTTSNLKDLIELLNDGEKFYSEAATKVKIPAYANLFQRMAQQKQAIASDLSARLASHGETAPEGGTMLGSLRKFYADVRASMSSDAESIYVAQLEQTEDRILEAFRDELTQSEDMELRRIAERHYPDVKRTHDEMRDLKRRLAA